MIVIFKIYGLGFDGDSKVNQLHFEFRSSDGKIHFLHPFFCEETNRRTEAAPHSVTVKFQISAAQKYVHDINISEPGRYPCNTNLYSLLLSSMPPNDHTSAIRVPLKIASGQKPEDWPKLLITRIEPATTSETILAYCNLER